MRAWGLAGFTPFSGNPYCSCFPVLLQALTPTPPPMVANNSIALPFLYCELTQLFCQPVWADFLSVASVPCLDICLYSIQTLEILLLGYQSFMFHEIN